MNHNPNKIVQKIKQHRTVPTVSAVLPDVGLLEMVHDPVKNETGFVVYHGTQWRFENELTIEPHKRLVPYSPDNNLIKNEVVLFPSQPEEYSSEEQLVAEVQSFIHRYVDVSPLYEKIASYYVLLSWVYDGFNELPYLRLRGDPGSGKTRFLLTVGAVCYKPMFASGASSVSPLFRIIDAFRGTLIIDEGDFRMSDEKAEIVKILNNGNARGFPVLRSEVTPQREFNPTAYAVFGPKLVATRGYFQDRALESRCITEEMGQQHLRDDVPISLLPAYKQEALSIRNKLLLFRFRNFHKRGSIESLVDRTIEPRLNQVFVPLLSIIEDEKARGDLRELARRMSREFREDRGMDTEAQILEVIRDMIAAGETRLAVKDITSWFTDRNGADYERKITPKWMGYLIRRKLGLKTQKSHGVFVIPPSEDAKLNRLYEKYGIGAREADERTGSGSVDLETWGTLK